MADEGLAVGRCGAPCRRIWDPAGGLLDLAGRLVSRGLPEGLPQGVRTVLTRTHFYSQMRTTDSPRLTSLAPQLLVSDLERSIAFYRDGLGFHFDEPWGGFYAIGRRDGLELH